jgi:hypothetical protein
MADGDVRIAYVQLKPPLPPPPRFIAPPPPVPARTGSNNSSRVYFAIGFSCVVVMLLVAYHVYR